MSLDERQIAESLTRYAEGFVMSTADIDRMQRDLHGRLGHRGPRPRRRIVLVAAAVLLLAAAAVGGALWLRRPDTSVPVSPTPTGSLTGFWKLENPLNTSLFVIRDDHTISEYPSAQNLVEHRALPPSRVTYDSQHIQLDFTDAKGQPCRGTWTFSTPTDGLLVQGPQTYTGAGCDSPSGPESTLTRLSPGSAASNALRVPADGPATPVTDAIQLDGVWLLQGTGTVLAVDNRTNPELYLLNDTGAIDTAPDAQGPITVGSDSTVTLQSPGCDTTLGRAEARGQGSAVSFTATVTADPCGRFGGRGVLTWIRVL